MTRRHAVYPAHADVWPLGCLGFALFAGLAWVLAGVVALVRGRRA